MSSSRRRVAKALRLAPVPLLLIAGFTWFALPRGHDPERREAEERETGGPRALPSEWFTAQRAYPGTEINQDAYLSALGEAGALRASSMIEGTGGPGTWQAAGPENIGGRITAIAVDPSNPSTWYIGAADGGVLKSTDSGSHWTPLTDTMGSLSVGALTIDPANPQTLWLGTGEANASGDSYDGIGIFKSTDGGADWTSMGLPQSYHINRILVDPTNSNIIWVAVSGKLFAKNPQRGVYKSLNGGLTWQQKLYVSDSTACIDLVLNPTKPDTVYAAMWERIRRPDNRRVGGLTSGVWRTFDGGTTWTRLAGGLPAPSTTQGRIGLAISKTNPLHLYAIYADDPGNFAGLFKTLDGGTSWTRTSDGALSSLYSNYGWYFGNVRVDPADENRVYAMGLDVYRSTNGGGSWSYLTSGVHVDQHDLVVNGNTLIAGHDGGLSRTTTGGYPWTTFGDLPITQFYAGAIDYLLPQRLYGGTQDNGTPRTLTGSLTDWVDIFGGDGFYCIVDPTSSSTIYAESQYGYLGKSTDTGGSFSDARNGINTSDRTNWCTPVVMDPSNHLTLYYGTYRLYRTVNGAGLWTTISGDLTNGSSGGNLVYDTITTIAVAPSNPGVVYVGTDDGNVWVTQNGGSTWTSIKAGLPNRWVTRVTVDPANAAKCYVTLSGYKQDSYLPHVFKSLNYGAAWTDISSNLPQGPANVIVVDPSDTNRLYLGTDFGVFASADGGGSWFALGDNLPTSSVNDMVLHQPTRSLVAMTHGRSMFRYDLSQLTDVATNGLPGVGGTGGTALALAASPNPSTDRVRFSFRLASPGPVSLRIYDVRGRMVRDLAEGASGAGDAERIWDGRTDRGGPAASGTYYARLVAGGSVAVKAIGLVH